MAASDLNNYKNIVVKIYSQYIGDQNDVQLNLVVNGTYNNNTIHIPKEVEGELITYCFKGIPKNFNKIINDWEEPIIKKFRLLLVMKKKLVQLENYILDQRFL